MNTGTNVKNSSGSSSTVRNVIGVIIFVLICVALYYLYNFLYGSTAAKVSVNILASNVSMIAPTAPITTLAGGTAVQTTEITGIMDGGQYSTSFWVYVSDTKGVVNKLAHLMEISDSRFVADTTPKGKTLLFIGLNPKNGGLVVRQNDGDDTDSNIDNTMTTGYTGTHYKLDELIDNYNTDTKYTTKDRCDILNGIEYQRWVLISTVANGKTIDVYIDGKLARSCIYKANYALGNTAGKGIAIFGYNNGGNLKGFFSSGKFYNHALTPDAVWALYQAGPGGSYNIIDFFSNLFSINVSFQSNVNLKPT